MYEQFVSDEGEKRNDKANVDDDIENCTDKPTNKEKAVENCVVKGKKIVFDDYPDDELRVNENGIVIQKHVKGASIKSVYYDRSHSHYRITHNRLSLYLSNLEFESMIPGETPGTLLGLLKIKFENLSYRIMFRQSVSDSDFSDYSDDYDCSNYSDDVDLKPYYLCD